MKSDQIITTLYTTRFRKNRVFYFKQTTTMRPTHQHMQAYTPADFQVWHTLFERQMQVLKKVACNEYLKAFCDIGFNASEIPSVEKINSYLSNHTGWQLVIVPNIVGEKEFFQLLSKKQFPVTVWLRTPEQLDYIEEPDMFHDVFGHVPLLANSAYAAFFNQVADIAVANNESPEIITRLGRIYWFTIEFGLMQSSTINKVYGAGIISSPGEIIHALGSNVEVIDYDPVQIMETAFNNSVIQNKYFRIKSFSQLYQSLPEIKEHLRKFEFAKET
ncbi:MAG: phenylalanine 4-monooxygenase [Flavobacteriales bacterium]